MKRIYFSSFFSIFIICSNIVFAQTIQSRVTQDESFQNINSTYSSHIIDLSFSLKGGYRIDQLDWSMAGYLREDYINVLSELIWKDIEIFQIQLNNKTIIKDTYYFRGNLSKGWIYKGSNQDTDYNGNDRTAPWSQSKNASDGGNVFDLSLGAGYDFKFISSRLHVTPLIGFSYHRQDLTITDGYQSISEPILDKDIFPAPLGPFSGLNSTYKTEWNGPWLGFDMTYKWQNSSQLILSIEYHWADYYAKANWNLIERFEHPKSFEHNADGNGIVLNTGWRSQFYGNWHFDFDLTFQRWHTDSGVDRTFFSDGSIAETRLNEINWESFSVMLGAVYTF
jgi:hypothetical protein